MNPLWPEKPALADTIKAVTRIKEALDWITADVARPENERGWARLEEIEPTRSRTSCSTWSGGFTSRHGGAAAVPA
jgi:hypothetical protein